MTADIPTFRVSTCEHCGQAIAEIRDGTSGATDWCTHGGDFGCDMSPESTDDACGSHEPLLSRKLPSSFRRSFRRDLRAAVEAATIRAARANANDPEPADPFSLPGD